MTLRRASRALGFGALAALVLACGGRAELGIGPGGSSSGGASSSGGVPSSGSSSSGGVPSSGGSSSGGVPSSSGGSSSGAYPIGGSSSGVVLNDCPPGGVTDGDPCTVGGPSCFTTPIIDCNGNEDMRPCTCSNGAWACVEDNPPVCVSPPSTCPGNLEDVAPGVACNSAIPCPGLGVASCGDPPAGIDLFDCVNGVWEPDPSTIQCPPGEDAGPGPMSCGVASVSFDWGTSMPGRCTAVIDPNNPVTFLGAGTEGWVFTNVTDTYVGGFFAQCIGGSWTISQEKCAARGASTTCFPAGTQCDGSGPAIFPYEHCATCCDSTPLDATFCE